MARAKGKGLVGKLQDAGEEAMSRIVQAPAVGNVVLSAGHMGERLEELQLKLRGLEGVEKRLKALERKVAALEKAQSPAAPRKPAAKPRAAAKPRPSSSATAKQPGPVAGP